MTLIWAEGFTGDKALAPAWRRAALAAARAEDTSLAAADLGAAVIEARNSLAAYTALVTEAEAALAAAAQAGTARTHVLVAAVGRYDDAGRIPGLTTSLRGGWAFADWMLTSFRHRDRPLGSVELLLSSPAELGDWHPSPAAAAALGLAGGEALPVEEATFGRLRDAFGRWLQRASAHKDSAAFLYFSGHGVWKTNPLLLPQDARLPSSSQSAMNLVDIRGTQVNMMNTQPSVQCFFIDACQELPAALLQNLDSTPGDPLYRPVNGRAIPQRAAWTYYGSYIGQKAYGPADEAPFFTQELLACLERRGAASGFDDDVWRVTTQSLAETLEWAGYCRSEAEAQDIRFSTSQEESNLTPELCHILDTPEVFVKVRCLPPEAMPQARLYLEAGGSRSSRSTARPTDWYTPVRQGACVAGAEFDAGAHLTPTSKTFQVWPPTWPVSLKIPPQGGGS